MRFLKYLGFFILGLIVLYLLLCFLSPKTFNISESKTINASAPVIFNLVNNINKWEEWNSWSLQDTSMVTTYPGKIIGVGAKSEWTSKKSGDGSQEIIESNPYQNIRTNLIFKGWDGTNTSSWTFSPKSIGSTDVTWDFAGTTNPFFMRGMMLVMGMKSGMKKNYRQGLDNIAAIAEARNNTNTYNGLKIEETASGPRHFIMHRQQISFANVQQFYSNNLGALFAKAQASNVEMSGMPCGLYFKMDDAADLLDMAAALPVSAPMSIEGAQSFSIEAKNVLRIDFYGPYEGIAGAHMAMEEYLRDHNYLQDVPVIEEYITDPSTEPDPAKWLTRISYYYTEEL